MFISVHFPKSGGQSLRHSLEKAFGLEGVLATNLDDPADPTSRYSLDPDHIHRTPLHFPDQVQVIHGHFAPHRYMDVPWPVGRRCAGLFTFLREPVENVISIYFFLKTFPRSGYAVQDCLLDYDMTLEQFAMMPRVRYLYTRIYFAGFDMGRFDLIGDTATYDRDIRHLAGLLGRPLDVVSENVNRHRSRQIDPGFNFFTALADQALCRRLRDILADDLRFYESLMARRENRAAV